MAGCFGSHPIDQWMERRLYRYLEETCREDDEDDNTDDGPSDNEIDCYEHKRYKEYDGI